ncbi:hypothetical protein BGW36DRAFT_390320 [Talaromyces proteolyticus]|uniref:Uncharacterized protein n=1 Tax=Talaromyces proteolyticus TaxID=1131652 RepID=A0AAD4KEN6_9EURO|nr:uncharacterized protein BGW36DRAFT_390320 [Talaromyces proteolyticus]KAH8690168.1 hypothetical protein BGW36DRAFT_390320 [Talaromyces proteolyticus]
MITIDCSVHKAWDSNLVALEYKETSADQQSMTLIFHWLKKDDSRKRLPTTWIESVTNKPDFPATYSPFTFTGSKFYNIRADTPIKSGDPITLMKLDPVRCPLPSKHLLRLQPCQVQPDLMSITSVKKMMMTTTIITGDDFNDVVVSYLVA